MNPAQSARAPIGAPTPWVPLTEAQEGLWYAQRLTPDNPLFNPAHCTTVRSPLDAARFKRAVDQTLAEAQALSLCFKDGADGPAQRVDPTRTPHLDVRDLRALPEAQARDTAWAWIHQALQRPVDPLHDPLSCQVLFLCGATHALWFQRVHHLAADGYGMALIERRAMQLYRLLETDEDAQASRLAPLAPVWDEDRAWRGSTARTRAAAFWHDHCAGHIPAASLCAQPLPSDAYCLRAAQDAPTRLIQALRALEAATDVSWPDILTTLGAAFVARHLGPSECVVGVPAMSRLGSASAGAVCTTMNVMPWVCALDETLPLAELLTAATRTLRSLRRHSRYQAEQLRRDLTRPGGRVRLHGPTLNVLPFDAPYGAAGLDADQTVLCSGPIDDLTLSLRAAPDAGQLRVEIEANPRCYTADWVHACLVRLIVFLENALCCARLADVPTLTAKEHAHWVLAPNRTAHPLPPGTLWSRIHQRLVAQPMHTALTGAGSAWANARIDAWTARAAAHLRAAGARAGEIVAVALPRSPRQVLCLLAVLRSGAAYLPLDPSQPVARLRQILEDAQIRLLIGPAALAAGLPLQALEPGHLEAPGGSEMDAAALTPPASPQDPAYVIYTSGSTGVPKGVVVPHAAIVNRLEWMRAHYAIGPQDRILYKTPATFDVSVWELFLPFLSGARLVVAPPDAHRDPAWLCRLIEDEQVTVLHFVPSMLAVVLDEPAARGLHPRLVFCSGEALPVALRDRFHRTMRAQLHNLYGPTEAAVDVSWWPAGPDDQSQPVPIGWPVWNTQLHVLDVRLRPVPAGTPGQLYLGGVQLATGYLKRPELTAERFVAAPPGLPGPRLYATGDLATRREDGAILYLGRLDHQVKLRGQRIELGEIESVLARHPAVSQAAVIAREDRPGQVRLAAYLVADEPRTEDGRPLSRVLADHVAARLPAYMVPTAWTFLTQLPMTANGKLDRRALPAPEAPRHHGAPTARTETEQRVAQAFCDVLGLPEPPAADEDFFTLGGHSLLAVRLARRLGTAHTVSLGTVFQYPTVGRLAAHLDAAERDPAGMGPQAGFGPTLTLRDAPGRPALFCIHPAGGLSWCYGTLARALNTPRSVHGLQADALTAEGAAAAGSLTELAARYADRIQAIQATGPYHLAGWSVGGILAQEIAVTLQARGQAVGVVALLDAYPCELWHDEPEPTPEDLCKALLYIAGADPRELSPQALDQSGVIAFLRARHHPLGELSDARLQAVFATVNHSNRLVRTHAQRRYDGLVLHFQAGQEPRTRRLDPQAWQAHVGTLRVIPLPVTHAELPGTKAIGLLRPALEAALHAAEAGLPIDSSFFQRPLHKEVI